MASYIWQNRHGTFYFRVRIPQAYQPMFEGRREFRRSLKTCSKPLARVRARALMVSFERCLGAIEEMAKNKKTDNTLRTNWEYSLNPYPTLKITPEESKEMGPDGMRFLFDQLRQDFEAINAPMAAAAPVEYDSKQQAGPMLSTVAEAFLVQGEWDTPKTRKQYQGTFDLLLRICGDKPISELNKEDARNFRQVVIELPPNINGIHSPYKTMSIDEILAEAPTASISATTVKHHLTRLSAFFNWVTGHYDGVNSNPFNGIRPPRKTDDEARDRVPPEDIPKLLNCYLYNSEPWPKSKRGREPSKFWIPLIAAFSGCRLNEACQLYCEDIRQDGDVWVFHFNDNHDDQSLKGSFARLTPIHPALLAAGIVEYATQQKDSGHTRLFPELTLSDNGDGYARSIGEFCRDLFRSLGVRGTPHCFRHSVIQLLTQADVELPKIQYMVGHKGEQSVTEASYGGRKFSSMQLREAMWKLDYGCGVSHVNYANFAARTTAGES